MQNAAVRGSTTICTAPATVLFAQCASHKQVCVHAFAAVHAVLPGLSAARAWCWLGLHLPEQHRHQLQHSNSTGRQPSCHRHIHGTGVAVRHALPVALHTTSLLEAVVIHMTCSSHDVSCRQLVALVYICSYVHNLCASIMHIIGLNLDISIMQFFFPCHAP